MKGAEGFAGVFFRARAAGGARLFTRKSMTNATHSRCAPVGLGGGLPAPVTVGVVRARTIGIRLLGEANARVFQVAHEPLLGEPARVGGGGRQGAVDEPREAGFVAGEDLLASDAAAAAGSIQTIFLNEKVFAEEAGACSGEGVAVNKGEQNTPAAIEMAARGEVLHEAEGSGEVGHGASTMGGVGHDGGTVDMDGDDEGDFAIREREGSAWGGSRSGG